MQKLLRSEENDFFLKFDLKSSAIIVLQSAAECSSTDSGRSRHVAQVAYPLHAAARHGHIDCLQILCQSGFDLDYVTEEGSALHVAALFGKVDAVKLLLEQGN